MSSTESEPSTPDRVAGWVLGWPLAIALSLIFLAQLTLWVPTYLVRPWWADLDVFATMARGWDTGLMRPYRDLLGNNFPGTIYLFWVLGRLFGWGNTVAIYAFDAALIVGFVALLIAWSVRRFGRALPGLIGAGAILGYFLGLDLSQSAQRDGQAPILAVAGLLTLQAWPGRLGRLAATLLLAAALIVRPQVVLFVPAYWLAIDESARRPGEPWSRSFGAQAFWTLALGLFGAAGLAPLALAGVLGDFIRGLKVVTYGSVYNEVNGLPAFLRRLAMHIADHRLRLIAPLAVALGGRFLRPEDRRLALTWGVALACIVLYLPLSPGPHIYMNHPMRIVSAVFLAILGQLILTAPGLTASWRLTLVALLLGLSVTIRPDSMGRAPTMAAIRALRTGRDVETPPLGFTHPFPWIPLYPWDDYRSLISYLREKTGPETRVANLVGGYAVAAVVPRLPAFPAESSNWITVVRPGDEARFVDALNGTPGSVVVWDPAYTRMMATPVEGRPKRLALLLETIPRLYEPAAKFGRLEVWTRKPDAAKAAHGD